MKFINKSKFMIMPAYFTDLFYHDFINQPSCSNFYNFLVSKLFDIAWYPQLTLCITV